MARQVADRAGQPESVTQEAADARHAASAGSPTLHYRLVEGSLRLGRADPPVLCGWHMITATYGTR
jgi:hypothetical protein